MEGRRGLDDLTRQVWQRRSRLQRDNRLDGTLQEVRELLARALEAERTALANEDSDDARFREMQLDALPSDTGGAVRELDSYDWRSAEAREAYQEIRDLLGREMLDQRFAGMKQAMQNVDAGRRRADPGDARRPELPAREPRPGAEHAAAVRRVHAQARRVLPREPAEHRRAGRPAGPAGRGRAADAQLDERRAARRAGRAVPAGVRRPPPGPGAGPARRAAAGHAAGGGLDVSGPVPRRQPAGHGRGHPGDGGAGPARRAGRAARRSPTPARRWRTSTSTRWRPSWASRPASTPARWPSWSASCAARGSSSGCPTARCGCRRRRCGGWGSRRCATSWTSSAAAAASGRPAAPGPRANRPGRPGRGRSATPRPGTSRAR